MVLLVMIKGKEEGLLSISEGRSKSMVPLLGDARILDFYLYPSKVNSSIKTLVNIKSDSIEIKDYINYHYRDYPVKVIPGNNLFDNILKTIRREKPPILIVQADGFLYCNWTSLMEELAKIKGENVIVRNSVGEDDFEAIYVDDKESFYDLIKKASELKNIENTEYDDVWSKIVSLSLENLNKILIESVENYYSLKTVKEYYDFHLALLNDMERCFKYTSIFRNDASKEKDDTTISSVGVVKDSYISASSYIEGTIEKSFIFSNVRVSKGAYVYESIIMNNNSIAENARLERVILCDGGEFLPTVLPRIDENALLGGRSADGYNVDFPEYLKGGISLIGSNVDIPRGFVMAENCYISSNTGKLILKEKKKLPNGESLINRLENNLKK